MAPVEETPNTRSTLPDVSYHPHRGLRLLVTCASLYWLYVYLYSVGYIKTKLFFHDEPFSFADPTMRTLSLILLLMVIFAFWDARRVVFLTDKCVSYRGFLGNTTLDWKDIASITRPANGTWLMISSPKKCFRLGRGFKDEDHMRREVVSRALAANPLLTLHEARIAWWLPHRRGK